MNSRERIITLLDRGTPDLVPTWDWFDEAVTLGIKSHGGKASHQTFHIELMCVIDDNSTGIMVTRTPSFGFACRVWA